MSFDMDTRDLDTLEKKIEKATNKFGGKPVEDILMKGARTIRKEARRRAPIGTSFERSHVQMRALGFIQEEITTTHKAGDLQRAVVARTLKSRNQRVAIREGNTKVLGTVYAGRGLKKLYHIAPHYHLVHDGTVERFHKSGKSVGRMTANPFFADAVRATQGTVLAQIGRDLDALFEKTFEAEGVWR